MAPLGTGNLEGPSGMIDKREILEATSSFSLGRQAATGHKTGATAISALS